MMNVLKTLLLSLALVLAAVLGSIFVGKLANADDRIHVGVVDTGIKAGHEEWYCKDALPKDFTGMGVEDEDGHGTNIAGVIASHLDPSQYCLVIAKYFHASGTSVSAAKPIQWAVKHGAKFINLSFSDAGEQVAEKAAIKDALNKDVQVIVASGNFEQDLSYQCQYFPACYKFNKSSNFHVVSSSDLPFVNTGGPVSAYRPGAFVGGFGVYRSGSSQSAANFTGELARSGTVLQSR